MVLRYNPHSFLTGDDPFLCLSFVAREEHKVTHEVVYEPRHEGFIGIPHGGLGMGLCLDAWRRIGGPDYPIVMRCKFGGSGVSIGDSVLFSAKKGEGSDTRRVTATLIKPGDKTPYLYTEIEPWTGNLDPSYIPGPVLSHARKLPYYRNCFVCGHHRPEGQPGLQRRFQYHHMLEGHHVSCTWGFDLEDHDRAGLFLYDAEELHPAVITSIFDENTAWAGFMLTHRAGLSVRLECTLLRPVSRSEKLLFVGRPTGVRGNHRSPRFFCAEGAVYGMNDPQTPEPVAFGRGEWLIMHEYTQQVKENLLPAEDSDWIFTV